MLRNAVHLQLDTSLQSFIQLNPGTGNQSQTWIKYGQRARRPGLVLAFEPARSATGNSRCLLRHVRKTGGGTSGLCALSTDLAIFDLPSMQLSQIVKG